MSVLGYFLLFGLVLHYIIQVSHCTAGIVGFCDNNNCPPGKTCVLDQVICKRRPCPRVELCINTVKPGRCLSKSLMGRFGDPCQTAYDACSGDSHCPGPDKCCPTNCGNRCFKSRLNKILLQR